MFTSRTRAACRAMVIALGVLLPFSSAHAQWHGGGWHGGGWHGGGWHGGGWGWRGGWGWHGGGWGWWPGVTFGFAVPPFYYAPPPAYYYPPPYYPPAGYYPPPSAYYYPSPYRSGYAFGYHGSLSRTDPNNCGTPDEPKPCTR